VIPPGYLFSQFPRRLAGHSAPSRPERRVTFYHFIAHSPLAAAGRPLKALFPSSFHRRLLLLAAGCLLPLSGLAFRVGTLTLTQGDDMRAAADAKLVRRQWTATVRGRILDRKGRVLAQDRPSYDLTVPYSVITGDWAIARATESARRAAGAGWMDLKLLQRQDLIAELLPVYRLHLDNAWNELAARANVSRSELDARRDRIISEVDGRFEAAASRRLETALDAARARGETVTDEFVAALRKSARRPLAEQTSSHVLIPQVSDTLAFEVQLFAEEEVEPDLSRLSDAALQIFSARAPAPVARIPGLAVSDGGSRTYPFERVPVEVPRDTLPSPLAVDDSITIQVDGVACHLIGRERDRVFGDGERRLPDGTTVVSSGDAAKRAAFLESHPSLHAAALRGTGDDRGGYRDGDRVGETGAEGSHEHTLRGLRGSQTRRLDTGLVDVIDPEPGTDAHLTIDCLLQARVQATMSRELGLAVVQPWHAQESATQSPGTLLNGAAVILDIDTAEILAMVSTPTFTRDQLRDNPEWVYGDVVNTPFLNRAVAKPYPPGSIVKSLLLADAVTKGNFNLTQTIECSGHLLPDQPTILRCWIYKRFQRTHSAELGHDLSGREGIMCSCNIFFFTVARRMGVSDIVDTYRRFGVGTPFRLGVGLEYPGALGSNGDGSDLELPDAIQMGIGQGPVAWTPLHAANAMATLARGGISLPPFIFRDSRRTPGTDLALDPAGIDEAIEGLRLSVTEELGTGHHITVDTVREPIFNAPDVKIWGKTGTAEAPDVFTDADGRDGPQPKVLAEEGDHSWFVIMVGRDRPRYVISVVIDYGGSGGKVSGPICNQIIHALIAEGYL